MWPRTRSTSQMLEYRGCGGLWLNMPFSSLHTRGCFPTTTPSIGPCVIEIADLYALTVRYCFPCWNTDVRKCRMELSEERIGSRPRSMHHCSHFLQQDEYAVSVFCLQEERISFAASSEIPSDARDLRILTTRLDSVTLD